MGTYRSKGINKNCVECPSGTTTEDFSTVHKEKCNTPKCMPGQFLVTLRYFFSLILRVIFKYFYYIFSKQCHFCPRGAYQDESLQTTCKLCAPDFNTAAEGIFFLFVRVK